MAEYKGWGDPKGCPICNSRNCRFHSVNSLAKHLQSFHKLHDDIAVEMAEKLDIVTAWFNEAAK